MRRSMKLSEFRENVEITFSEAKKFSSGSLVPLTDSEVNKLRISIAENFLHLKHGPDSFLCVS